MKLVEIGLCADLKARLTNRQQCKKLMKSYKSLAFKS